MHEIQWPSKSREMHSNHFESTVWNDFQFRDDDIIVSTYGKSGTTWVQQIIAQLIFNGAEGIPVAELSPWLDLRVPPAHVKLQGLEAQTNRRFIKTHLPVDALVYSPKAKYIYIARDGRDVAWSLYNHHTKANEKWYGALNDTPGLVGPPMDQPLDDVVEYYERWLDQDGYPFWSPWENIRSWWDIRHLPNLKLMHFNNLKTNMAQEIRDLAEFLEIEIDPDKWDDIVYHCGFEYMKNNSELTVPLGGALWTGGAKSFIHKGNNGRWREMLSPEQAQRYVDRAKSELGDECAHWLITGEMT